MTALPEAGSAFVDPAAWRPSPAAATNAVVAGTVPATVTERATAGPAVVLAVVSGGVVLANLDLFIVNVAFPDLVRSFPTVSLGSLSWVLNAYTIVFASLLVLAGRLSDRWSRRGGFLAGVTLFTAGSALCAVSPNVPVLVAARSIQAMGAAALIPTSMGLVLAAFPPDKRGGAIRTWAAIGGVAAALGPVVGGLLVEVGWQWVFLINLPVGVVTLIAGLRVLPADRQVGEGALPDLLGAALVTVSSATVVLALIKGSEWGWGSGRIVGLFAAAVATAILFVQRSRRHASPIVHLDLFRIRGYGAATLASLVFAVSFAGMLLSAILWAQDVWGWSALRTGLGVAPGPMMVPVLAIAGGGLSRRFGAGRVAGVGAVLFAAGLSWWAFAVDVTPDYAAGMLPGLLVTGIAVGLVIPTLMAASTSNLPPAQFATGSGVVNMARQIGSAVGVAVLVAVIGTPNAADVLGAFQQGWLVMAAGSLVAAGAALSIRT